MKHILHAGMMLATAVTMSHSSLAATMHIANGVLPRTLPEVLLL